MEKEQSLEVRVQLTARMQHGQSWRAAAAATGLHVSQSTAYRLLQGYRMQGSAALRDGRHGHRSLLRGAARAFLEEQCRQAPQTPSSTIQMELRERFDLSVSISQINRVRAALGLSNHPKSQQQGKKSQERGALSLNQRGRKALGVSCCLLLRSLQNCFLS
jgi:transposase